MFVHSQLTQGLKEEDFAVQLQNINSSNLNYNQSNQLSFQLNSIENQTSTQLPNISFYETNNAFQDVQGVNNFSVNNPQINFLDSPNLNNSPLSEVFSVNGSPSNNVHVSASEIHSTNNSLPVRQTIPTDTLPDFNLQQQNMQRQRINGNTARMQSLLLHNNMIQNVPLRDDDGLFRMFNGQYNGINPPLSTSNNPSTPLQSITNNYSQRLETKNNTDGWRNDFNFDIQYKTYPKELYKKQKRLKGTSEQRIENGNVEFYILFPNKATFDLVHMIKVEVQRTNEHPGTHKYVGPVKLEPRFENAGLNQYLVKIDLDSVYKQNDKKVYELQKTLTKELNLFHLIVTVTLQDGRCCVKNTEGILLIGKKNVVGAKRPASILRNDSVSSNDSPVLSPKRSPSSGYVTPTSPTYDEELLRMQNIVAEHIKTKSMHVTDKLYAEKIISPNGDIAYHLEIKDPHVTYYEGQVIGFLAENGDESPKIVELTSDNAKDVVLKGVVTRSQYFEARKPKDQSIKTETVCMMGIVPVLVHGSVKANDALYASPHLPGFAVAGRHLSFFEKEDAALIGYAFQSLKMADEDETGMVQAGISVLTCASQILLNRRLRQLNISWTNRLHLLKRSNKNMRRCICWSSIIATIILSLTAIFLWQALAPGTAYRYFRCRQGAIKGRSANYAYPTQLRYDYIHVNGIEFEFEHLMEKTDHKYNPFFEAGARYFLNIDRCAYGGTRRTADENQGLRRVGGPDIFVANKNCTHVYQYFEVISKWYLIDNVSWKNGSLHCYPQFL